MPDPNLPQFLSLSVPHVPGAPVRPRLTIGVMGASGGEMSEQAVQRSFALGQAIARAGCVLVNGACPGLPHAAAMGAKAEGGLTVGVSPGLSLHEHVHKYDSPTAHYDVIVYTGSGLMGREVTNIRSSDIVVFVGGRSGTLGEFAIAYDEGKLMGVLEGTGGITDALPQIVELVQKDSGAHLIYDDDPERLVHRLVTYYQQSHHSHPSCFDGHAAAEKA